MGIHGKSELRFTVKKVVVVQSLGADRILVYDEHAIY